VQGHDDQAADADASPRALRKQALIAYGVAAAASMLAGFVLLRLWRADLRVPFDYHGDALYFEMVVKAVVDHGWFLTNPNLGAPGVLAMHDFPSADSLHLLIIKVMSWVSSDWALIYNLYFLLGFPLITMSALAVFRHFRVAYVPALAASLLFAFLPSRLLMGEVHYFLSIFYEVPLAILVALWVAGDDPPLDWRRRRGRTLAAIAICLLVAGTGVYYAFFAGALIALGGIWGALRRRAPRNALAGLMLTGVIMTGLGLQGIPNVAYHLKHGANAEAATRQIQEAEVFGLRVAQLLLPATEHRVPVLRQLKRRYDAAAPFPGESSTSSLGVVGGVGFLVLLGTLLLPVGEGRPRRDLWRALGVLNLLALLIATTGGFGSLFALLVTPDIRTYLRMHVFIGFLALFAVVLLLERLASRVGRGRAAAACAVVLAIGIFDQVTPLAVRDYARVKSFYVGDAALVRGIEAAMPARAMILELPYQVFPEGGPSTGGLPLDYKPLRPSFHSRSLHWSYPAMRGRPVDAWAQRIAALPPADLVRAASEAGFDGILINRKGYTDHGAKIEAALLEILGPSAARAVAAEHAFFSLVEHNRQALAAVPPEERARRRELAAHTLFLRWTGGFYAAESGPHGPFRWSSGTGDIVIDNSASFDRLVTLSLQVKTADPPTTLTMGGDLLAETATVGAAGLPITRTLRLAPGLHTISMSAEGKPAYAPWDPRRLVWRVENVGFAELPSPAPPSLAPPSPAPPSSAPPSLAPPPPPPVPP
jgi:phosphoglycerol transferase